jgi:hypothetical protein
LRAGELLRRAELLRAEELRFAAAFRDVPLRDALFRIPLVALFRDELLREELFLDALFRDALFRERLRDADAPLRPALLRPPDFRPPRAPLVDLFLPPFEPPRDFFLAAAMISAPIKKFAHRRQQSVYSNFRAQNHVRFHSMADSPAMPAVRAPDFPANLDWIHTGNRPLGLTDLRGKIVLLDFWTYG